MPAHRLLAVLAAAAIALGTASAGAETAAPTVVELFTSQSCSSCPPAEALLGELAARPGIVALEYHVDYWDDLSPGRAGRWRDVLSDPANTERQRRYNRNLTGVGNVYTPQLVVDGRVELVGSRRDAVEAAIRAHAVDGRSRARVTVTALSPDGLGIELAGPAMGPMAVWLARFERSRTTTVAGGENQGRTLTNRHAVTGLRRVGTWSGGDVRIAVRDVGLGRGDGCAVLVQDDRQGPIAGAALCP
jgi:hypothetical protein